MTERVLEVAIIHQCAETRNTLHAAVSQLGHKVCFFSDNGREFVDRAQVQRPDLVIVQRSLPDMDGLQAVRYAGNGITTILVIDPSNSNLPDVSNADTVFAILQTPIRTSDVIPAISLAMRQMGQLHLLRTGIDRLTTAVDDDGKQVFTPPPVERSSNDMF